MPGAGDCYLVETNHDHDGVIVRHLLVVLLDPEEYTKRTIIVPVDTLKSPKHDQTTLLNPGDHEFIKVKSYINYRMAKVRSTAFIESMIANGKATIKPPMADSVLEKIVSGLRKSPHTPDEVMSMYGNYFIRRFEKQQAASAVANKKTR